MRYELTDHEWSAIRPMLPNKPRGVPQVNDRRVLNGIFWVLRSGAPWRESQRAMTSWRRTTLHSFSLRRSGYGYALMSPRPSKTAAARRGLGQSPNSDWHVRANADAIQGRLAEHRNCVSAQHIQHSGRLRFGTMRSCSSRPAFCTPI